MCILSCISRVEYCESVRDDFLFVSIVYRKNDIYFKYKSAGEFK